MNIKYFIHLIFIEMNPNDKKDEKPVEKPKESDGMKLQRKLKFKTLDGNIKHLECDYDIKISELKKKLAEIYKIEPYRQRLLNKGKQFKDDEFLDKLVDKDDTTIHLVFRSEEDAKRAQENAQNNNNASQTTQNQNVNPFQNILNVVTNSDEIRNLTNNIVTQLLSGNNNNNNNVNNNNRNNTTANSGVINIRTNGNYQTLNIGETLNLNNSPLNPIQHSSGSSQTAPPLNLNQNNNNNAQEPQNVESNKNLYSSQFPIMPSNTDRKYEMHLKKINKELEEADKIMSQDIEPKIPLPLLNTTQNVFTAISRCLRKYVIVNQNILCNLMRLADLMEREQFIAQREQRMIGNKLLDQAYKSLSHISKASSDLSNVIKSSNFNNAPNTGYIGIICQEIGLQRSAIGEMNTDSILSALRTRNANNTQNNMNNMTTINLNNLGNLGLGNNVNNNQNQPNLGATLATIPISISVIDSSDPPLNLNTNIGNIPQQTTTISSPSVPQTNNVDSNKEKEEKKESIEPKQKKEEEKKQEVQNNTTSTNNKTSANANTTENNNAPNTQNNTSANNNSNAANNNDFNNLFGNIMNQLMSPENMNSIVGAVDNMINNPQESNNNGQGGGFNFGNLLGNIMNSINIEDGNISLQNNQPTTQQTQQKKEEPKKEENNPPTIPTNNANSSSIFEQLVKNEQLRKDTKISDDKVMGETMSPNIEFSPLSDQIVSNLTVQDMFDMYNLNFGGLCRMRKEIQSKYFTDKSKCDDVVKNVVELLCERIILIENQIDKILPGKEFILEDFFNIELKKILLMFIDDNEVNLKDDEWEQKFRKLVIDMFKKLIDELKNLYETGEDGAKTFVEFNITGIIENFIGNKYLTAVQNYDDNVMNNFVENLFNIIKNEENKNKCDDKKEEKENKEKKEEEKKNDNNEERPTLLSIDEIFKIATKDKERLEKEEKEKDGDKKEENKYSEFYYMTSLFKN